MAVTKYEFVNWICSKMIHDSYMVQGTAKIRKVIQAPLPQEKVQIKTIYI